MTTTVVNLRASTFDVYIGRAGKGYAGAFGNPSRIGFKCDQCGEVHHTAGDTIPCFRLYFYQRLKVDPEFKSKVHSLNGKTLGCFCKPGPCHGDIISEYLNSL